MALPTSKPEFAQAHAGPATVLREHVGRHGELSTMWERDLNLVEAADFSMPNWNLTRSNLGLGHEGAAHLGGLGALKYAGHPLMQGKAYQGSFEAEIYVIAFSQMLTRNYTLPKPYISKQAFIEAVHLGAWQFYRQENINRICAWFLARERNIPFEKILSEDGPMVASIAGASAAAGVRITEATFRIDRFNSVKEALVTLKDISFAVRFDFQHTFCSTKILQDVPEFSPDILFKIPDKETMGAYFDALEPALRLLIEKIHAYRAQHPGVEIGSNLVDGNYNPHEVAIYSQIKFREMVEVLAQGMKNQPVLDQSAGCDLTGLE